MSYSIFFLQVFKNFLKLWQKSRQKAHCITVKERNLDNLYKISSL